MAAAKIPYPPSPTDVPEGLTDYPDSFTRQQNRLLAGLFVFLIMYIAAVIFFAMIGVWCALTISKYPAVKIIGLILSGTFFLYLVKGFFKSAPMNKEMQAEITEEEQPVLFGFIQQLCDELGAPEPNKVFVAPDVNAACISRTSLINLFVEPKRDLLIGLGLVNCTNLSEFKAVLAHEFGHFCHLGHTSSYTVVVKRIIFDLVEGEDWFDRIIDWFKRQDNVLSWFGYAVGGCLWVGRQILWWMLKMITLQDRAVSREQEFHADLVAVSAAGSDASTHGLLRARFGMQCFMQAVDDLATALDHKLYSNDLYLHQDRAASEVRRKKKEPELGLPPMLAHPAAGKDIKVFDAEQDELEDEDDTPPMWRTHPSDADREENAKEQFVAAPIDHRSPWILFENPADLKERLTYKFYRMVFHIPKNADLAEAKKVQEYIDNEHSDTTYDPKYHGAYDNRPLEPGDLEELNAAIRESPWPVDRMEKVYDKLYDGCRDHAEARADLQKDLSALRENVVGKPSPKMKRKIEEAEKKLEENWEWFKSFDRRAYLLHVQMAAAVNKDWKRELIERYQFQREVQRLYEESQSAQQDAFVHTKVLFDMAPNEVPPDFLSEVMQVLRTSWRTLKKILQDAKEINLPAMKNFEEGENLASFILPEKMVPEPPLSYVKGTWCMKLVDQLDSVRSKCFRLHFKSVGGILALQEKIATAWKEASAPVCAEIVEPEAILAEAIPAEVVVEGFDLPADEVVLPAEVIPAEVVVESFVEALPIDDVEEPPPLISGAPPTLDPGGVPMAAFVSSSASGSAEPRRSPVTRVEAPVAAPVVKDVLEEPPPLPPIEPPPLEPAKPVDPKRVAEPAVEFAVPELSDASATPANLKPLSPPPGAVEVAFSLDLDAGRAARPAPATPVPAEEIFSLDANATAAAEAAPKDAIFSLDADADIIDVEPIEDEPVVAEILEEPSIGSGSVAAPAARPTPGTGSSASMPALSELVGAGRNGVRKRPPVKITLVGPGQKSPFA